MQQGAIFGMTGHSYVHESESLSISTTAAVRLRKISHRRVVRFFFSSLSLSLFIVGMSVGLRNPVGKSLATISRYRRDCGAVENKCEKCCGAADRRTRTKSD